jgi:hypothetical protein
VTSHFVGNHDGGELSVHPWLMIAGAKPLPVNRPDPELRKVWEDAS